MTVPGPGAPPPLPQMLGAGLPGALVFVVRAGLRSWCSLPLWSKHCCPEQSKLILSFFLMFVPSAPSPVLSIKVAGGGASC